MAKILITSIGTGNYDRDTKTPSYRPAHYYTDDINNTITSAYVYDALLKFHGFDRIIFVGTCGSQWYMLYEHIYQPDSVIKPLTKKNEEYTLHLMELDERNSKNKCDTAEMRKELDPLKLAFGDICAEIIVLNYGLDEDEHKRNFELLATAATIVKDGDSLSFDITHSFRSLAIYEFLVVSFIKDTLKKNVSLDYVSYGMYDFAKENNGKSPIVDLSVVTKLTDWIKAVEEYNRFGTAYLLADLLEKNELGLTINKESKKALKRLGDATTGIERKEFISLIDNCVKISNYKSMPGETWLIIGHIFEDIANTFGSKLENSDLLLLDLAKRHFKYHRYIQCAITLIECLLDFCATLIDENRQSEDWDWEKDEKPFRNKVKDAVSKDRKVNEFLQDLKCINDIRNHLAHGGSLDYDIRKLKSFEKRGNRTVVEVLGLYVEHLCIEFPKLQKSNASLIALREAIKKAK